MNPVSSRATATATLGLGLPRSSMGSNRRWRRCMALSAMPMMRGGWPSRRFLRLRVLGCLGDDSGYFSLTVLRTWLKKPRTRGEKAAGGGRSLPSCSSAARKRALAVLVSSSSRWATPR